MTILFPDVSAYNANVHIASGTSVVVARATLSDKLSDQSYQWFKNEAARVGAFFVAYHWLNRGNAQNQATWARFHIGDTPLMVDAEDVAGNTGYAGTLRVSDILDFVKAYRALGGTCNLVYLPHWYWLTQMGSPDLTPLVNAGLHLIASEYRSPTGAWPSAYGHMSPDGWQYTDALPYGGGTVDFNAYKGTVQQLIQLATGSEVMGTIMMAHEAGTAVDWVGNGVTRRRMVDANDRANTLVVIGLLGGNPTSVEFNPGTLPALGIDVETLTEGREIDFGAVAGGLTDADRALIQSLMDGVGALNNRLATP